MSVINNIKLVSLGQATKILTQLVTIFYLTSLIGPSEFGLLAMAGVVVNLALLFNDLGLSASIIQKQNINIEFYNYIYKINIITGLLVMTTVLLISPFIAQYFHQTKLISILCLLSLSFPITAFGATHKANLEKNLAFEKLIKIEIFASLVSMIVAIIMANMNFGVYSIVFQTLIYSTLTTILFKYISQLKLSLRHKNNVDKKGILSFSSYLFSFNLINYFSRNLDIILIGRFFSTAVLGSYSLAYRIMLFPVQNFTFVLSRVFLPYFSNDLNNLKSNRDIYIRSLKIITALASLIMLGLVSISNELIYLFLGNKWLLVSDLLFWLAPTAILQTIISTTGSILTAYNKTNILFFLGIFGTFLMGTAFLIGINFDIKLLVLFYFIANIINFFPALYFTGKILNFKISTILVIVLKFCSPSIATMLILLNINAFLPFENLIYLIIFKIIFGLSILISINFILNKSEAIQCIYYVKKIISPKN